MKIIALFLAMGLERLATHLFHWRELRWLDPLFDIGLTHSARLGRVWPYLWLVLTLAAAVAPVVILRFTLEDALLGLPYLVISVVVLFLCLGPQDIGEEVDRWCRALSDGDEENERIYGHALLERGFTGVETSRGDVPGAVFVQANNRIFAVIFWFVLLGPIGAWLFRVSDLARRRALFQAERDNPESVVAPDCEKRANDVHAILAWLPARIAAVGYTLAGNYDAGREAWGVRSPAGSFEARNEHLLREVGLAALSLSRETDEADTAWFIRAARAAKNLALRTLWFWLVGVAVLTLFGVAV
ncbi:MAG: regulatory signaling modulator protein AmpE [Pseudomonadota bacterium]